MLFSFTGYGLKSESLTGQQKILAYHRYAEAFKFANGLKKHIRDPNFSSDKVRITSCSCEHLCTHLHMLLLYTSQLL